MLCTREPTIRFPDLNGALLDMHGEVLYGVAYQGLIEQDFVLLFTEYPMASTSISAHETPEAVLKSDEKL
jgi:hypothetical protein